ncbi:endonuclease/exonuclease/phosphatase family protein [Prevotella disiens]|uniref:endonuclease/exonuclease/phosphatase family protein n=1 Tax=Prevotella disiens TaxID=28130 RepID=UPI00242C094D|nr:endonuclease/exonuclease/phosphatase family protein [Prevotella disiens]
MVKRIKHTAYWLAFVANIIAILAMFLVGNVDRLHPSEHPWLSCLGLIFPVLLVINLLFLLFWVCVRLRTIWLPVLGLLICYVPIRKYTPFNITKEHPARAIKVLSYNVYMFSPWDLEDLSNNPIVKYIQQSNADIVCLQETDVSEAGGRNVYEALVSKYPYYHILHAHSPGNQHMMVLSKFPIKKKEQIKYQSVGNITMAYILDYNGTDVLLVNNHLESNHLSNEDKAEYKRMVESPFKGNKTKDRGERLLDKLGTAAKIRAQQVEIVAKYVKTYLDKKIPVILCGDFNDSPISYARRTISEGLTDCYVASGNGPGISYHRSGMYVRIDNIFCSDDFVPYGAKVDDKITNSDHYPIYVWLKYRPKP